MKKEIAILGSTGSIGKNLISIINQYPNQTEQVSIWINVIRIIQHQI